MGYLITWWIYLSHTCIVLKLTLWYIDFIVQILTLLTLCDAQVFAEYIDLKNTWHLISHMISLIFMPSLFRSMLQSICQICTKFIWLFLVYHNENLLWFDAGKRNYNFWAIFDNWYILMHAYNYSAYNSILEESRLI